MGDYTAHYSLFLILPVILLGGLILFTLIKHYMQAYQSKKLFKRSIASGMPYIDKMDGLQFEVFLKHLFNHIGYKASETRGSHDYGADVLLEGKNRIVIQAKRYGSKNKVGIKAIQEVYTAKTYFDAAEAWVVTNNYYTKSAKEVAAKCHVKLLDRNDLEKFILDIKPPTTPAHVYRSVEPESRSCPSCKHPLIVRSKEDSRFFGCTTYPKCTHTEPINAN